MELWFTEEHTPNTRFSLKVKEHLYHAKSEYQTIDVIDTFEFGKVLLLDGMVMLSERDEAGYHEMIVHIPAFTHPSPKRALVVGGGDGGTVRELLKHQTIEAIDMVEIDKMVVETSRVYLPSLSHGFSDQKVNLIFQDGIEFVKDTDKKYDLVLIDSIDPVGAAVGLFARTFYQNVLKCLNEDGIICLQCESSLYDAKISKSSMQRLQGMFPIILPYLSYIPTYPSAQWVFVVGSKKYHPLTDFRADAASKMEADLGYYNCKIHRAAFALPAFLIDYYK
ncbi:MAG: polyamine aminopropyltransferase [candidate division Zixibacteria bacterium]|nr:polyamine aminopropyltransferase [Candidatus Tariuqbacter arcticus]